MVYQKNNLLLFLFHCCKFHFTVRHYYRHIFDDYDAVFPIFIDVHKVLEKSQLDETIKQCK